MLCSNALEEDVKSISVLDNLDIALHELGMLSTETDARRDYLDEKNRCLSILQMNTRYVSNVTIGFRMKKAATSQRLKPYPIPERNRTKSENSEGVEASETQAQPSEPFVEMHSFARTLKMKRHRSLENLKIDSGGGDSQPSKEVEIVSDSIRNLTVDES